MYQYLLSGTVLLFCSVTDIRHHRIYKSAAALYFFLAFAGRLTAGTTWISLAAGLLPGACCLLISWLSRDGFGYGDSVLVAGCGMSLGLWFCLAVLLTALMLSGLWAAGLMVFCRAGRKREIPFVPFLFLGLLIQWIGGV